MNGKTRSLFFICLGLLFGMSVMYVYNNFIADKSPTQQQEAIPQSNFQTKQEILLKTAMKFILLLKKQR